MKRFFICFSIFFCCDFLFAQITISCKDWCIDEKDKNLDTIINKIPLYQIHDSLFNFLNSKIKDCVTKDNSIFSSYDMEYREGSDTYQFYLNLNFPLNKGINIFGLFFIEETPVFIVNECNLDPNIFFKTTEFAQAKRIKSDKNYVNCFTYETNFEGKSLYIYNQFEDISIQTCIE